VYRSYLAHLLIAVTMAIFCFASCDSYNIVEPRFYSEEDIVDVQWEDASHRRLNIAFTLPEALPYQLYILGSAGEVVRSYKGMGCAGLNVITWDRKDSNGEEVEDGVYAVSLKAGEYKSVYWFEIDS
jgi:hypothetical protein